MLSLVVKLAPASSTGAGGVPPPWLNDEAAPTPSAVASVLVGIGCAEAATGIAKARTHAASSAKRTLIPSPPVDRSLGGAYVRAYVPVRK